MLFMMILAIIVVSGVFYAKVDDISLPSVHPIKAIKASSAKRKGIKAAKPTEDTAHLSRPGRVLVSEFNNLDERDRPGYDIIGIVEALDVKYEGKNLDTHYEHRYHSTHSWDSHDCQRGYTDAKKCKFYPEYMELHTEFEELRRSRNEQERAFKLANAQPGFDNLEAMRAELRRNAELNREVTQGITNPHDSLKELG